MAAFALKGHRMRAAALALVVASAASLSAAEFDAPWKDPTVALVLDPYFANSIDWDKLATERRVVAIIHKATIGTAKLDPGYVKRKEEARTRGYLWAPTTGELRGALKSRLTSTSTRSSRVPTN